MSPTTRAENSARDTLAIDPTTDYGPVLKAAGIEYEVENYYYKHGAPTATQGWIIHISIVRWQLEHALAEILPVLAGLKTPFKVVQNKMVARMILDGALGLEKLGKVITLYPNSSAAAITLIVNLEPITQKYKGPKILTDLEVGTNIYTRFGSFVPPSNLPATVMAPNGQTETDQYAIPYTPQPWLNVPFEKVSKPKQVKQYQYRVMSPLRENPKGGVFKGVYLKNGLIPKVCVIKEGIRNMWSNEADLDMGDRIKWQYDLLRLFEEDEVFPKAYDIVEEEERIVILMEFIESVTLREFIEAKNKSSVPWIAMSPDVKAEILNVLKQTALIIEKMHQKGILHRDITPENFVVTEKNKVLGLDIEMAYDIQQGFPLPAFQFGTEGFAPTNQRDENRIPKSSDDIYGLGATVFSSITNVPPGVLSGQSKERRLELLRELIGDNIITKMIYESVHPDERRRPKASDFVAALSNAPVAAAAASYQVTRTKVNFDEQINRTIDLSLNALLKYKPFSRNDLWHTPKYNSAGVGAVLKASSTFFEGISGILYTISYAKNCGTNVSNLMSVYKRNWQFIDGNYLQSLPNAEGGLNNGYGVAIALNEGIKAGMVPDSEVFKKLIRQCLNTTSNNPTFYSGLAGKLLAISQCESVFTMHEKDQLIQDVSQHLWREMDTNLSWIYEGTQKQSKPSSSFIYGNSGILFSLIKCDFSADKKDLIKECLDKLDMECERNMVQLATCGISKSNRLPLFLDNCLGALLALTAGYIRTGDKKLRKAIIEHTLNLPDSIILSNMTINGGLPMLLGVLIGIHKATGDDLVKNKMQKIADLIVMLAISNEDYLLWQPDFQVSPNVSLLGGQTGVLYSLIRYKNYLQV
ncbi:class III lanthionine synthetase LanKC N-terminal domain-containing protein [Chitinophaga rhizosphaerae]|uniref:class III lanthionine synthetase LanKC N-terminal domain-containing protein n=1 Tax=Chitinophaga rhizosphaerae TaxID=1864947 RepID=UPI000F803293|nr:lanthionine synthetase LanC family protein [Chitinophaga rhizosphaerae]